MVTRITVVQQISKQITNMQEAAYNLVGVVKMQSWYARFRETEHTAYEVAGQLIKTVGDTAEKLLDIQENKRIRKKENKRLVLSTIIYVGSTLILEV